MSRPCNNLFLKKTMIIINEEINNVLIEVLNNPLKTDYKIINKDYHGIPLTTYRFRTKSFRSYDLEFYNSNFNYGDVVLNNCNKQILSGIDIAFSTTNKIKKDYFEYELRTRYNEQYELFSRISYLINEYINKHPDVNCYIIGYGEYLSNMRIYKNLYENIFSNVFDFFEGTNLFYPTHKAIYFLRKM